MEVVHVEQLFTQQHLLITIQVHLESLLMQIYLVTSYFLMKLFCQIQLLLAWRILLYLYHSAASNEHR